MRKLIVSILAVTLAVCSAAQEKSVKLIVSGEGRDRTEATKMALRSAVEQAYGTFVSANTTILNDDLVRDEIATVSSGNIESYREIGSYTAPDGLATVSLEAVVSIGKLISYSKAHGSSAEFAGNTFMFNHRLRELNRINEQIALTNILVKLDKVYSSFWSYSIEVGEPRSSKAVACSRNSRFSDESWQMWDYPTSIGDPGWDLPFKIGISTTSNLVSFAAELKETLESLSLSEEEQAQYRQNNIPTCKFGLRLRDNYGYGLLSPDAVFTVVLRSPSSFVSGFAQSLAAYMDPMTCCKVTLKEQNGKHDYTIRRTKEYDKPGKKAYAVDQVRGYYWVLDGDNHSTLQDFRVFTIYAYGSFVNINDGDYKQMKCHMFFPGNEIEKVTGLTVSTLRETNKDHRGGILKRCSGTDGTLQFLSATAVSKKEYKDGKSVWSSWEPCDAEFLFDFNAGLVYSLPEGECRSFGENRKNTPSWFEADGRQRINFIDDRNYEILHISQKPGSKYQLYTGSLCYLLSPRLSGDGPERASSEPARTAPSREVTPAASSGKAPAQDGATPQTKAEPAKDVYSVTVFSDPSVDALSSDESIVLPVNHAANPPRFNGGGFSEFNKWVNSVLEYPESAKENGIQGRVMIQFTITADGDVSDVSVKKGVEQSLDEEAVQVVSLSPKWIPAVHEGHRVPVSVLFPIIFQLR